MTVVRRKWKAGVAYTRFGCTAHDSRGESIFANGLSVSERKAQSAIFRHTQEALDRPDAFARFETAFRNRAAELESEGRASTPDLDRSVRDADKRIAHLIESLAHVGWSEALSGKLAEEERRLETLKRDRSASVRSVGAPARPIDTTAMRHYLRDLFALLDADTARGREALAGHLRPIVMTPEIEGSSCRYRATGAFNLSVCFRAVSREKPGRKLQLRG